MSKGICACFAVVAMLVCGTFANAAQPSASKMAQMGLGGAKVVSDGVAMQVRGEGARSFGAAAIIQVGPSAVVNPRAAQLNLSVATNRFAVGGSISGAWADAAATQGGQAFIAIGAGSASVGGAGGGGGDN